MSLEHKPKQLATAIALLLCCSTPLYAGNFDVMLSDDNADESAINTLSWAIREANRNSGDDSITLKRDVVINHVMLNLIDSNVVLQSETGSTYSISGNNQFRPLFVKSGTVLIKNINLINGKAKGGDGCGGGAGFGGALFVYAGTVTLDKVGFNSNNASGGQGITSNIGGGGMFGAAGFALYSGGGGLFADAVWNAFGPGGYGGNDHYGGFGGSGNFGGNGGFGGGGGGSNGSGGFGGFGGGGGGGAGGGQGGFGGGGGYDGFGASGGFGGFGGGGANFAGGGYGGGSFFGGGAGFGGALFVKKGTVELVDVSFSNNSTMAGAGVGAHNGAAAGNDIFICTGAQGGAQCNAVVNACGATNTTQVAGGTLGTACPDIAVSGNAQTIANGDTTPSTTDDTDFGLVTINSAATHSFTISNPGNADLILTGTAPDYVTLTGAGCAPFSVTQQPGAPIVAGAGSTFDIAYTPTAALNSGCTVSIDNDVSGKSPYTFDIQGVGKLIDQSISNFTAPGSLTYSQGGSFTVSANASSGLDVSFSSATSSVCSVTGDTVTILGTGDCIIHADQAGSDIYAPAAQQSATITITQAGQTINFTNPGKHVLGAGTFNLSATGGDSSKPVTFSTVTTSVCTLGGDNNATVSLVGAGECTVTASQAGDVNYAAASDVTLSFVVVDPVCRVNAASVATKPDGGNWDITANGKAYTYLQDAIANSDCSQIWVAQGIYKPSNESDHTASFNLRNNLAIYGGFNGSETQLDERNSNPATNNTVLSGDIGIPNDPSDNSLHVVSSFFTDDTAVLDGFTITDGKTLSDPNNYCPDNCGGGIYNEDGGPILSNLIISHNYGQFGGGMNSSQFSSQAFASPLLTNVSFSDNNAVQGGGLFNEGSDFGLISGTFAGNSAGFGGGLWSNGGVNLFQNVTLSENSADTAAGAIYLAPEAFLLVIDSTISSNTAVEGGGVYIKDNGIIVLINTLVAGNTATTGPDLHGTVISLGYNLIGKTDGGTGIVNGTNNDIAGSITAPVVPLLSALGDYGGVTKTMALLPGSPAIDAGDDMVCADQDMGVDLDQRGIHRPQGPHCDIGAFESQGFSLGLVSGDNQSTPINTDFGDDLVTHVISAHSEPVDGGKATFTDKGTTAKTTLSGPQTQTISSGQADLPAPTANSIAGSYTVSASAWGVSGVINFNLNNDKGSQIISFDPVAVQTYSLGGIFTLSATGGASGNPVVFASTTTGICTVNSNIVSILAAGICTISANQAGDDNYNPATEVIQNIAIAKATQSIGAITPIAATYSPGGTFSLSVDAQGASTSPVVFASITTGVCTVSTNIVTLHSAGVCTISANQAGDTNYNPATQVLQNIVIGKAAQSIDFTPPPGQVFSTGGTFNVTATASSGLMVSFSSMTTSVCNVSGSTVTMVAAGTCTIAADQAGDNNYNAAPQVTHDISISIADQSINFSQPPVQTYSAGGSFSFSADASSGLTVSFSSTTPDVCTVAGATAGIESAGTCSLIAEQAGNANFHPAPPVTREVIINKAGTSTRITNNPGGLTGTGEAVITYSVTPGAPTGNVTVSDGENTCKASVAEGQCSLSFDAVGPVNLSATYTGDINFLDSIGTMRIYVPDFPAEIVNTLAGNDWQTYFYENKHLFKDPVLIVNPPSYHDPQPGVARLRNITPNCFDIRFQPWDYLSAIPHADNENMSVLVLEKGVHYLSDGSIWEVGTFPIAIENKVKGKQSTVAFQAQFAHTPRLFLTIQSYNCDHAVTVRTKALSKKKFTAVLDEQTSNKKIEHPEETVGYLAIYNPNPIEGGFVSNPATYSIYMSDQINHEYLTSQIKARTKFTTMPQTPCLIKMQLDVPKKSDLKYSPIIKQHVMPVLVLEGADPFAQLPLFGKRTAALRLQCPEPQ